MKTANWATVTALMAAMGAGAGVAAENEPTPGQVTRVACDLAVKPNSVVDFQVPHRGLITVDLNVTAVDGLAVPGLKHRLLRRTDERVHNFQKVAPLV